ncbi:MAG: hypothetical protein IIC57_07670 [Proteobacteria bacterium]|nr:hypothetical protein [Pseudomonadota bacterium]
MTTDGDLGMPGSPADEGPSEKQRDMLRAWAKNRHGAYVALALEMATLELNKGADGGNADISYDKLRRRRQELEETRSVLSALSQQF